MTAPYVTVYERRATARRLDNERRLCGETLADFHARENPARTAPGAGIPKVRCKVTPDLFWTERRRAEANEPAQSRMEF